MPDQRLADYVEKSMQRGYSPDYIRRTLISAGWPEADVDYAFQNAGPKVPQAPASAVTQGTGRGIVKKRSLAFVYIIGIITFGIYFIYWYISTKDEMNKLGAKIPTAWLLIIPIANLYWEYKYCEGFSTRIKKDNNAILWFILFLLVGIIIPAVVQPELNKLA